MSPSHRHCVTPPSSRCQLAPRSRPLVRAALLAAFALTAGACAGSASDADDSSDATAVAPATTATPTTDAPPDTTAASTTTPPTTTAAPTTTVAVTTTTEPAPDGLRITIPAGIPTPEARTIGELLTVDRPLVIAHAGGDQEHPHSTPFAYATSALAGVDMLEMDVQLTADGVLIVHHDDTTDGTTGMNGVVRDLTYDEIAAMDNAWWYQPGCWPCRDDADEVYTLRGVRTGDIAPPTGFGPDDFAVATFVDIATAYPDHPLDIEIKVQRGPDGEADPSTGIAAATELARLIDELDRTESVIVTSFNDDVIAAFRELAPDVATSPGLNALTQWFLAGGELHPSDLVLQVPPDYTGIEVMSPDLTARAHAEGRAVWVWPNGASQENPGFYAEMFDMGADGIIAGAPVAAVAALAD